MTSKPIRVCLITTLDKNLEFFYKGLLPLLSARGAIVTGISSAGPRHDLLRARGMNTVAIEIARTPNPLKDFESLVRLGMYFCSRRGRHDLIVLSTPKAAFLAAIAATLSGQRRRLVYVVRGRAYENLTGIPRYVYSLLDRFVCSISPRVIVISRSLKSALAQEAICSAGKMELFASGSSKGVNLEQFSASKVSGDEAQLLRRRMGIPPGSLVIGYVGWLRRDKGTEELIEAALDLCIERPAIHFLLVGSWEDDRDPVAANLVRAVSESGQIHHIEWLYDPSTAFAAMDIFVFPSHREGFGNVAIEAAAMGLPIVATDVIGVRDAVEFGRTAIAVPPRNSSILAESIRVLIDNPHERQQMGARGRERVVSLFDERVVLGALCELLLGDGAR